MRFFSPKITFAAKASDSSTDESRGGGQGIKEFSVCASGGGSGGKQQWQKHPWLWGLGDGAWRMSGEEISFYSSPRSSAAQLGMEENSSLLPTV